MVLLSSLPLPQLLAMCDALWCVMTLLLSCTCGHWRPLEQPLPIRPLRPLRLHPAIGRAAPPRRAGLLGTLRNRHGPCHFGAGARAALGTLTVAGRREMSAHV